MCNAGDIGCNFRIIVLSVCCFQRHGLFIIFATYSFIIDRFIEVYLHLFSSTLYMVTNIFLEGGNIVDSFNELPYEIPSL